MSGDGGYDTHFAEIGKKYPGINLAILENGQYNEDWKYIHTLPKYLGQIARDLNVEKVLTVHHSKYALARHPWNDCFLRFFFIVSLYFFSSLTFFFGCCISILRCILLSISPSLL